MVWYLFPYLISCKGYCVKSIHIYRAVGSFFMVVVGMGGGGGVLIKNVGHHGWPRMKN